MTSRVWSSAFGRVCRAGILAALAIALTGGSARADEPAAATAPPPEPETTTTTANPTATATATTTTTATTTATAPLPWLAQPAPAAFTATDSRPHSSRMLWIVLPALGLGGAALYMRLAKRRGITAVSRRLEILDTSRVGPKAHVVMIAVGGRQLLLGVTEQSVQRLAWLSGEPKVDAKTDIKIKEAPTEAHASEATRAPDGPFAHILRSFTQGKSAAGADSDVALKIAAETKDTFERRSPLTDIVRREPLPGPEIRIVNSANPSELEEQVSGLRKRRTGKNG